ncbi:DUF2975 domain-containing protein [Lachnospiraceae bacterium 50-23]
MNVKLTKFTKYVLDIMFFGGILVLITLPVILKLLGKYYSEAIDENFFLMLAIMGVAGVLGILIIWQLRKMMKTVLEESCFVYENVQSLNRMAVLSLVISVLFIMKLCLLPTPATGIIVLVFFIAALFSEVLSRVFAQAVSYKEENDFTI